METNRIPRSKDKANVYTMGSSGIRLGAWGYIIPIKRENEVVAAKIRGYAEDTSVTAERY